MDNRFRREKNLSRSATKKSEKSSKSFEKIIQNGEVTSPFVSYFLDAYRKIRKYHVFRDTVLLTTVLLCFLFAVSWALPRVFSFHFDPTNILSIFNSKTSPVSSESGDETGDIDILIL